MLEYTDRAGGRYWTLRGGDTLHRTRRRDTDVEFDRGLYINPGPWRIPYNHHAVLDYCKRLGVALEPFIQVNYNAFSTDAAPSAAGRSAIREISGLPGRRRRAAGQGDAQGKLDELVAKQDQEILLEALRAWGALNADMTYAKSHLTSDRRGFDRDPGGGLTARPVPSQPVGAGGRRAVAPVVLPRRRLRSTSSRPRCSSRSAAWT